LYKQGLEESNFNKFLAVLAYCIGGGGNSAPAYCEAARGHEVVVVSRHLHHHSAQVYL
jgi:hypothetical protein